MIVSSMRWMSILDVLGIRDFRMSGIKEILIAETTHTRDFSHELVVTYVIDIIIINTVKYNLIID